MQHILTFLEQLEAHNTTERMHTHQPEYKQTKETLLHTAQTLIDQISIFDPTLGELYPQETIFRLAKDTRFSKDKSPYKTNMGIVIAPGGKKSIFPCYYLHLQPGNRSFLAWWVYHPEPDIQTVLRDHLLLNRTYLEHIISETHFLDTRGTIHGDAYKKIPRDYPLDHPAGDLFKQKDWLVTHPLSDNDILAPNFLEKTIQKFRLLTPYNQWLHSGILTHLHNT